MSRKDYVLLARALNAALSDADTPALIEGVGMASRYVAASLSVENPRFDREHFMQAVFEGVGSGAS